MEGDNKNYTLRGISYVVAGNNKRNDDLDESLVRKVPFLTLTAKRLSEANSTSHALCHRDQIIRFGRFPDRNKALGRQNTLAEQHFLEKPFC